MEGLLIIFDEIVILDLFTQIIVYPNSIRYDMNSASSRFSLDFSQDKNTTWNSHSIKKLVIELYYLDNLTSNDEYTFLS
jgi:hypothetical protein